MTITITGAPKLNAAQLAAYRAECLRIDAAYPGQYVAYTDEWDGDDLRRTVVGTGRGPGGLQQLLAALDPATRRKVLVTRVPETGVVEVPSTFLD